MHVIELNWTVFSSVKIKDNKLKELTNTSNNLELLDFELWDKYWEAFCRLSRSLLVL
jgi:hypothetical protein